MPLSPGTADPDTYEIRLSGLLDARWAERLEVPSLTHEASGTTVLRGIASDQAVLHGLLQRIRDLGLPLISVVRIDHDLSAPHPRPRPPKELLMTTPSTTFSGPRAETLIRLSGLAAIGAGLIFAGIQPIHPADVVASVTTSLWAVILSLKFAMCLLMLIGIAGIYLSQLGRAGWLGFAGFALLIVSWFLQTGFVFTELFIFPRLAPIAPDVVDSLLTLARGGTATVDIGGAAPAYAVVAVCYLLGGLLFGIATYRAGVLPRWAGALWMATAFVTPAAALVPHAIQRYAAVPMGLTLIWLGVALWTRRRSIRSGVAGAIGQQVAAPAS